MAERKELGSISIITDTETGMYHMDKIDGGFDEQLLIEHIRKYGHMELVEKLTLMLWKVWEETHKINSEKIEELHIKLNEIIKN
jgi:hypothetical protein